MDVLCDLRQVTSPPWASISPLHKGEVIIFQAQPGSGPSKRGELANRKPSVGLETALREEGLSSEQVPLSLACWSLRAPLSGPPGVPKVRRDGTRTQTRALLGVPVHLPTCVGPSRLLWGDPSPPCTSFPHGP